MTGLNRPFVVWGSVFLWLVSMLAIVWSLVLFICLGDMLMLTETDIINSFVLLLGILLLPINIQMLYYISTGRKIRYDTRVLCCPLWLGKVWIIIVSIIGAILCILKLRTSGHSVNWAIGTSLQNYRTWPKYKRFIDNLQWSLQCCGSDSYKDWFNQEWYDKSRDYEWDPSVKTRSASSSSIHMDSVPLSCCKSGSCISNYLMELGTRSINTRGCKDVMYNIIQCHMGIQVTMFLLVILTELYILKQLIQDSTSDSCCSLSTATATRYDFVQRIMSVNQKFDASSDSYQLENEDSQLSQEHVRASQQHKVASR